MNRSCDSGGAKATNTGFLNNLEDEDEDINNIPLADDDPQGLDPDLSQDEQEEKASRIAQVLELQNTLDDLSQRVESVKEENLKLRSENQVLGQYIESLMSASSVFQPTSPKTKRK